MIKINLGSKKQAAFVSGGPEGTVAGATLITRLTSLTRGKLDADTLKQLPILKMGVAIGVCLLAQWFSDDFKSREVGKIQRIIEKLQGDKIRMQTEVAKTKGYEQIKSQLEQDEFIIKTKIETIDKLITDRKLSVTLLLELSDLIPKDVWLSDLKVRKEEIAISGQSLELNQVSDFIKNLNESAFFQGVQLKSSNQRLDVSGHQF